MFHNAPLEIPHSWRHLCSCTRALSSRIFLLSSPFIPYSAPFFRHFLPPGPTIPPHAILRSAFVVGKGGEMSFLLAVISRRLVLDGSGRVFGDLYEAKPRRGPESGRSKRSGRVGEKGKMKKKGGGGRKGVSHRCGPLCHERRPKRGH